MYAEYERIEHMFEEMERFERNYQRAYENDDEYANYLLEKEYEKMVDKQLILW